MCREGEDKAGGGRGRFGAKEVQQTHSAATGNSIKTSTAPAHVQSARLPYPSQEGTNFQITTF